VSSVTTTGNDLLVLIGTALVVALRRRGAIRRILRLLQAELWKLAGCLLIIIDLAEFL
jgi:hypothetical protein